MGRGLYPVRKWMSDSQRRQAVCLLETSKRFQHRLHRGIVEDEPYMQKKVFDTVNCQGNEDQTSARHHKTLGQTVITKSQIATHPSRV